MNMYELSDSMNRFCRLPCMTLWQCLKWLIRESDISKHLSQSSKATWSGRRQTTASSTSVFKGADLNAALRRAKVRHLRGDFIKVMECSDKDHVGFLDIRSFVYLRQCSNSSKFVDITYVIGPRETLKLYILANIPPSLKPKGDERWNSERWLRAHIVTLSQVLAVATEESFFSTRRIFSAGNVWAETNFRRLTSNQGDFCVAQKENIDILEYALKGKHSNRTRDC